MNLLCALAPDHNESVSRAMTPSNFVPRVSQSFFTFQNSILSRIGASDDLEPLCVKSLLRVHVCSGVEPPQVTV
jgi:hypothetical protein